MTTRHAQHGLVLGHIHFVIVGTDLLLANWAAGGGTKQLQHVLGLTGCLIDGSAHIHLALLHDNAVLLHLELGHGCAKGLVHEATLWHQLALLVQLDTEAILDRNDGILASAVLQLHNLRLVAILQ